MELVGFAGFAKKLAIGLVMCLLANDLQPVKRLLNPGKVAGTASGLFLVSLILFLSLLSASPALHKLIHSDADEADHHCAVTEFVHGKVDSSVVAPIIVAFVSFLAVATLLREIFVFPLTDYRFSASRAPPV